MKRALTAAGLVACVAGCGAGGHGASVAARARFTTARFFTAVEEMDGRVACPMMTSGLLGRMQRSQPQPPASRCQQAMWVLEGDYGLPNTTTGSLRVNLPSNSESSSPPSRDGPPAMRC